MKIICGDRGIGKTTKLIKHASKTGSIIIASTTTEKRYIQEKAKRMYDVKMITNPSIRVVTPSELKGYGNDITVSVDDAEYVLQNLLGCKIDAITINKEFPLRGMNHPVIVTSENPYETEQPEERIKSLEERVNWLERQLREHCAMYEV